MTKTNNSNFDNLHYIYHGHNYFLFRNSHYLPFLKNTLFFWRLFLTFFVCLQVLNLSISLSWQWPDTFLFFWKNEFLPPSLWSHTAVFICLFHYSDKDICKLSIFNFSIWIFCVFTPFYQILPLIYPLTFQHLSMNRARLFIQMWLFLTPPPRIPNFLIVPCRNWGGAVTFSSKSIFQVK